MGLQPAYSANNPPTANVKPAAAWTPETVPVTDGKERQLSEKDGFLKMFIAQLQNQDPMNPVENTEMTAQLAQFSQLEQLTNLNTSFGSVLTAVQAQNQFQSLSLIGKDIKAENNSLSLQDGAVNTKADFQIQEPANVQVYILDGKGNQVRLLEHAGTLEAGAHEITWDGRDRMGNKVPDGRYYFQIYATNLGGEEVEAYPSVQGKVTSVTFDEKGQPFLHLGNALVGLSQIMEILQAAAAEQPQDDGEG